LATEGHSQHEIARTLGISQPAVCQILRRADRRWLRDNADRVTRHKAEQTRKLEHVYREALHAWEQSKRQRTRRRHRKTDESATGAGGAMAEVIVDDAYGDPRCLEVARHALADLAKVWGVSGVGGPESATHDPPVFTLMLGDERTGPRRPVSSSDGARGHQS
jgi:predicted transcriptional regulator